MIKNDQKFRNIRPPEFTSSVLRFERWFDRDNPISYRNIPELDRLITGQQWLSLTQAPCATTLKGGPKTFLKANQALAHELGIKTKNNEEELVKVITLKPNSGYESDEDETHLTPVDEVLGLFQSSVPASPESLSDDGYQKVVRKGLAKSIQLEYSDPWKIQASRALCSVREKTPPELRIWYADLHRISDPIPPELLGQKFWEGMRVKKRVRPVHFHKIKNIECSLHLIKYHTHWGSKLWLLAKDKTSKMSIWAETLKKRLKAFLKGEPDPVWSKNQLEQYYTDFSRREYSHRALRLIEVLKTLSGMFVQRYLTFPEEIWTWEKFDVYNLKNLSFLLTDEFFDGECTESVLDIVTYYKSLKTHRKLFKRIAMNSLPVESVLDKVEDWLRADIPVWKAILARPDSEHKAWQIGIYCQSRGCGTPPMIDVLRSKKKFVETVTIPAEPLPSWKRILLVAGLKEILLKVPDEAFTGLVNKASITVTTSACLEKTVKEGGTTQAIADELGRLGPNHKIPITDLLTGKVKEWVDQSTLELGEKIFWHCVRKILSTPPEELRKVSLLVVKEPGKARCVTKGLSYLKVVLDVISKICSQPLKKGIASSHSGMSKESHGWEFFKSFFGLDEPSLFSITKIEKQKTGPNTFNCIETYRDVFVSSTDYETATDYMGYEVAHIISDAWMTKCGIPPVLRGIVIETCYKPREISFSATGPIRNLGLPTDVKDVRKVTSSRGVLMGDPLTKPCLHLVNVLARTIAMKLPEASFLQRVVYQS